MPTAEHDVLVVTCRDTASTPAADIVTFADIPQISPQDGMTAAGPHIRKERP